MRSLRVRIALTYGCLVLLVTAATGLAAFITAGGTGRAAILGTTLLAVGCLGLVAAIALSFIIDRTVSHPLEQVRAAMSALAAGSSPGTLSRGTGTEVGRLAAAFDEMAAQLHAVLRTREQEGSRLQALLASSADGIVALDGEGAVRYLNRAAIRLFGDASARQFAEVARSPELTSLLRSALARRLDQPIYASDDRGQTALIYLDARELWLQATVSSIAGGGGWALLIVLRDVTEVRRADTTRRDFVANVSHELRTPLAGIKAVVETLRDGALEDPEAATPFLEQVDGEVDRLVQLVDELLQLARIESGAGVELSDVRVVDLLDECISRFRPQADRAGIGLMLDVPPDLPTIRANPSQLAQAVGNLVHNALKFTPAGGQVTVVGEHQGRAIRIGVTDTGSGIDPADLPRVFERFYVADRARRGGGTGLGLAIVKHVVRVHDGTVEARSVLGGGSTFTIFLPVPRRA